MIFIWGKKHTYKKLGFVADFCPICRTVTTFRLDRVGLAGHVYYISFGKGELVGYTKTCMECKTALNGNPDLYREISKQPLALAQLLQSTFPNLQTHHAERLALEQAIRHSPASIPAETRYALLKEPFVLLNPVIEKRYSSTQIDKYTALTFLAAAGLVPLVTSLGEKIAPTHQEEVILGYMLAGLVAVAIQGFLQNTRFFEEEIFPVLLTTLKPLKPTAEEITAVMGEMKKADTKIGKKLKLPLLLDHLAYS